MFSFLQQGQSYQCAYPSIKETLPASTLGYSTNNRFPQFPPMMKDGRSVISSWQPEAIINDRILKQNNIQSNWEYRKFIRSHANEIIEHNLKEACNDTGYIVRDAEVAPAALAHGPYRYTSIHDNARPLGLENESDLKTLYLSRERLDSRKVAPTMTQSELIEQFGIRT
jgi:hypothetical protein